MLGFVSQVFTVHNNDQRKHTTFVTSPLVFCYMGLLPLLSVHVHPQKMLCTQCVYACCHGWPSYRVSTGKELWNELWKPFSLLMLEEMLSVYFLMSLKLSSKILSVVSIILLPLLAPYRVSAVLAQIALFWYCIKQLISSITTGCLMIFCTSSVLRKTNYLHFHENFCSVFTHLFTRIAQPNTKGSKSGSTWKSFRKVK